MPQYIGLVGEPVWNLLENRVDAVELIVTPAGIQISPPSYDALQFMYASYTAAQAAFTSYDDMADGPFFATNGYLASQLTIVQGYQATAETAQAEAEASAARLNGTADFPHPFMFGE